MNAELKQAARPTKEMDKHADAAIDIILNIAKKRYKPLVLVETRIYNDDINEQFQLEGEDQMFGTTDAGIVEIWGTLDLFDYKFGSGHVVSPVKNTQMIQYALGLANKYNWEFSEVAMHIIQPRGGGKTHKTWTISIDELRDYWRPLWVKGVARVQANKSKPMTGNWCHWCPAKQAVNGKVICPAKREQIKESINKKTLTAFDTPF